MRKNSGYDREKIIFRCKVREEEFAAGIVLLVIAGILLSAMGAYVGTSLASASKREVIFFFCATTFATAVVLSAGIFFLCRNARCYLVVTDTEIAVYKKGKKFRSMKREKLCRIVRIYNACVFQWRNFTECHRKGILLFDDGGFVQGIEFRDRAASETEYLFVDYTPSMEARLKYFFPDVSFEITEC